MEKQNDFDYIVVLSSAPRNEQGLYPNVKDGMYLGGQVRMGAAVKAFGLYPGATFIMAGGYEMDSFQSKAKDMAEYLKSQCPGINILEIDSLPCTRHNLIALFNKFGEMLSGKNIGLLTNEFHMARSLAWWEELTGKEYPRIPKAHPIPAESLAGADDAKNHPREYRKRQEMEQKGLIDIRQKTYTDSCYGKLGHYSEILKSQAGILLAKQEQRELTGKFSG